jgi:two-component system CheB/CheR fusion protein
MSNVADDMELADLIARLNAKFGKDLSSYRLNCLGRRISLRISTLRIGSFADYCEYLSSNSEEIEHLLDTVTIHVTEFFRDAEVFEAVARDVLPSVVARRTRGGPGTLRVWSAGCSTGEEAYSLAIVVLEYLRAHPAGVGLEVFATDISKEACRTGRRGVYDRRKIEQIPAPLRDRYFEPVPEGFRVAPAVRRVVLFSVHDLFQSVPYSHLDIVVCRNVLIHFDHVVRNEVIKRFHEALGRGGVLVLGKTEAITGSAGSLFELVDPRNKMYVKICSAVPEGGTR